MNALPRRAFALSLAIREMTSSISSRGDVLRMIDRAVISGYVTDRAVST